MHTIVTQLLLTVLGEEKPTPPPSPQKPPTPVTPTPPVAPPKGKDALTGTSVSLLVCFLLALGTILY